MCSGLVGSYWYATAHYVVTAVVLVWLYRRGPATYAARPPGPAPRDRRRAGALPLLPMAPPRLTGGYVDVLGLHSADGWWGSEASAPRGLGGFTNQLAAFPSLHAGWALWVALAIRSATANRAARAFGWTHALVTAVVVVGTGNHWVLDAGGRLDGGRGGLVLSRSGHDHVGQFRGAELGEIGPNTASNQSGHAPHGGVVHAHQVCRRCRRRPRLALGVMSHAGARRGPATPTAHAGAADRAPVRRAGARRRPAALRRRPGDDADGRPRHDAGAA